MKKLKLKQIIREEIFRIIKEEIELPDWIDKENNILITMPDGSTETFYFYDDDGEGTSYHASSRGGLSTLTYRNSDDSYEAEFEAYSATGDPDNPEYDDMEIVSFKKFNCNFTFKFENSN